MSTESKNWNRNRSSGDSHGSVEQEVKKLMRKNDGKVSPNDFARLRMKYDDVSFVESVQKLFIEKYKKMENVKSRGSQFSFLVVNFQSYLVSIQSIPCL